MFIMKIIQRGCDISKYIPLLWPEVQSFLAGAVLRFINLLFNLFFRNIKKKFLRKLLLQPSRKQQWRRYTTLWRPNWRLVKQWLIRSCIDQCFGSVKFFNGSGSDLKKTDPDPSIKDFYIRSLCLIHLIFTLSTICK